MKTFFFGMDKYEIRKATAIALCDKENEKARQPVLYISSDDRDGTKRQGIVFNWKYEWIKDKESFVRMTDAPKDWETIKEEHHLILDDESMEV